MIEKYILKQSNINGIKYLVSPLLEKHDILHMFPLRDGGVSKGVFSTLNFAVRSGDICDEFENVLENHERAANVFSLCAEDICRVNQQHTGRVILVGRENAGRALTKPAYDFGADGAVTDERGVLLSVRYADCAPVLLYGLKSNTAAAVHSGRAGTLAGIVKNAVKLIPEYYTKDKDKIIAAIGPCARKCCYEVGSEILDEFCAKDLSLKEYFLAKENGKYLLDLPGIITRDLKLCGLKDENISDSNICTVCGGEDYFSHRRQGYKRGTAAAFIAVRNRK